MAKGTKGMSLPLNMSRTPGQLIPIDLARFMKENEPGAYSTKPKQLRYSALRALYSQAPAQTTHPASPAYSNNLRMYQLNARTSYHDNADGIYETMRKQVLSYRN